MTAEQRACRSCGAPVYWLRHASTAQLAPIDVRPTPLGDCILDLEAGTYRKSAGVTGQHLNHFASCPQSAAWKRSR